MSNDTERVGLSQDERYPSYSLDEPSRYNPVAEVESEKLQRWCSAIKAYNAVQDEMHEVYAVAHAEMRRAELIAKAEKEAAAAQSRLDELRANA